MKNKYIALTIFACAAIIFFFLYISLDIQDIQFKSLTVNTAAEVLFVSLIPPSTLWLGLYFYSGKRLAFQIGGTATLLILLALLFAISHPH